MCNFDPYLLPKFVDAKLHILFNICKFFVFFLLLSCCHGTLFSLYGVTKFPHFRSFCPFCKEKCPTGKISFSNWKNLFSQLESAKNAVGRFFGSQEVFSVLAEPRDTPFPCLTICNTFHSFGHS